MRNANSGGAELIQADLSGANLSDAISNHENEALNAAGWEEATWTDAHFHYLDAPHFPDGMIYTDHGITVRTPEPAAHLFYFATCYV